MLISSSGNSPSSVLKVADTRDQMDRASALSIAQMLSRKFMGVSLRVRRGHRRAGRPSEDAAASLLTATLKGTYEHAALRMAFRRGVPSRAVSMSLDRMGHGRRLAALASCKDEA